MSKGEVVIIFLVAVLVLAWEVFKDDIKDGTMLDTSKHTQKGTVVRQNYVAARRAYVSKVWVYFPEKYLTTFLVDSEEEHTINNKAVYHAVKRGDDITVTITRWLRPDGTIKREELTHYEISQCTECPI